MIDRKALHALLHYNRDSGYFTYRSNGKRPGGMRTDGYWRLSVFGKAFSAHRLAWFYVHGIWPPNDVDHINGVRSDNRLENLRLATRSENLHNVCRPRPNNTARLVGAHKAPNGRWQSAIREDGTLRRLGTFDTPEAAHAAYMTAKRALPFAAHF